jgi:hypothetical protein
MSSLRRIAASPLELLAVFAVVASVAVAAAKHVAARDVASARDEAIGVLSAVRKGQQDFKATRGHFATSFEDLRGALADQGATVAMSRRAQSEKYTYILADGLGDRAWRVTAIGNLDDDNWPDIVVVQGTDGTSEAPVVTSDDVTHRVRRSPTPG